MKPAVFIERDGILNKARVEANHPASPLTMQELRLNLKAVRWLRRLKELGLMLIVTTNQPGICRGYQSRSELDRMHAFLRANFPVDEIVVCPHDEMDSCPCRKPRPGLFTEAAFNWRLDMDRSFVLSDKWQDAEAARVVGCTSVLVQSPWIGTVHRDFLAPTTTEAVEIICGLHTGVLHGAAVEA